MLAHHNNQLSQYPGLVRAHGGAFSVEENQALNLTTNPQQFQQQSQQQQHYHQLQHQQQQQQQTQNYPLAVPVQDLPSRPVQRVSPAVQQMDSANASPIPEDFLLKPAPQGANSVRRGSGDVTTIEVPLSRYSSVLASALPAVTTDGNALAIKRKDFIASRKKREFIPDQAKDGTYWDKRRKNNEAAKRSREKRRLNDIVLEARVLDLTQENDGLREKLNALAERFGIADIDSLSPDEIKVAPLVKIKQEPSSPPPHKEPVSKTLTNECAVVENTLHERPASRDQQSQSRQYCQNQSKQLNSAPLTKQRHNPTPTLESNSANRQHHSSAAPCATKVPQVQTAPVNIHVPNQHQLASQPPRIPPEMISALMISKDAPTRVTNTSNDHVQNYGINHASAVHQNPPTVQRPPAPALAELYGMEQRPASSITNKLVKSSENPDSVLPQNTKKSNSTPSLIIAPEDGELYSSGARERKISQCSEDSTTADDKATSSSHSVFANAEATHKLPHKLRGKTNRAPTPPESISRVYSPSPSSPTSAELSPRALVIDVSNHQLRDYGRAVEINGICTPPSSTAQSGEESLPSSPGSVRTGSEELPTDCPSRQPNKSAAKPTTEPYTKMVMAAKKLAMVSSDTDSTPKPLKRVHCSSAEEEQQYWEKRRRYNEQAMQYNGLPVAQQVQAPVADHRSTYLEFENSQLRNELKMLSQDVATLKNLIHTKVADNGRE